MKAYFRRLLDHMSWADGLVLDRLAAHPHLHREIELLSHVLGAERVWIARLLGEDASAVAVWPKLTVEECRVAIAEMGERWRGYLDGLDEGVAGGVRYSRQDGTEYTNSVQDVLTHVFIHGAYHRGQIAQGVRESGYEPVSTDFINFARAGG